MQKERYREVEKMTERKRGGRGAGQRAGGKKNTAGEQDRRIELKEMNGKQGSGMQTAKITIGNRTEGLTEK